MIFFLISHVKRCVTYIFPKNCPLSVIDFHQEHICRPDVCQVKHGSGATQEVVQRKTYLFLIVTEACWVNLFIFLIVWFKGVVLVHVTLIQLFFKTPNVFKIFIWHWKKLKLHATFDNMFNHCNAMMLFTVCLSLFAKYRAWSLNVLYCLWAFW